MSDDGMIRIDPVYLDRHAEDYCRREQRIAHELTDLLKRSIAIAPPGTVSRVGKTATEAENLTRYFSSISGALTEASILTTNTSQVVLEHLEDAIAGLDALLK